ncbi:hypothetical protein LTR95_002069 [Oleoguttula sp. CCFEE 5521]
MAAYNLVKHVEPVSISLELESTVTSIANSIDWMLDAAMSVSSMEFCSMHGGWVAKVEFERNGKTWKTCNKCSDKKRGIYEKQKVSKVKAAATSTRYPVDLDMTEHVSTRQPAKRKRSSESITTRQHDRGINYWPQRRDQIVSLGRHDWSGLELGEDALGPQIIPEDAESESMCSNALPNLTPDIESFLDSGDSSLELVSVTQSTEYSSVETTQMLSHEHPVRCSIAESSLGLTDGESLDEKSNIVSVQGPLLECTPDADLWNVPEHFDHATTSDIMKSSAVATYADDVVELEFESVFDEKQRPRKPVLHERWQRHREDEMKATGAKGTVPPQVPESSCAMDALSFGLSHVSLQSRPVPSSSNRTWASSNRSIMQHWSPGMAAPMATTADDELLESRGDENIGLKRAMWQLGPLFNSERKLRNELFDCVIVRETSRLKEVLATGICDANRELGEELAASYRETMKVSKDLEATYPKIVTMLDLALHFGNAKAVRTLIDHGNSSPEILQGAKRFRDAKLLDCVHKREAGSLQHLCNQNLRLADDDCSARVALVHAVIKFADSWTVEVLRSCFSPRPRGDGHLYGLIMAQLGTSACLDKAWEVAALIALLDVVAWGCTCRWPESVMLNVGKLAIGGGLHALKALIERGLIVDTRIVLYALNVLSVELQGRRSGAPTIIPSKPGSEEPATNPLKPGSGAPTIILFEIREILERLRDNPQVCPHHVTAGEIKQTPSPVCAQPTSYQSSETLWQGFEKNWQIFPSLRASMVPGDSQVKRMQAWWLLKDRIPDVPGETNPATAETASALVSRAVSVPADVATTPW